MRSFRTLACVRSARFTLGAEGKRGAPRLQQQAWNPVGRKRLERPPSFRRGAPRPPSAPALRLGFALGTAATETMAVHDDRVRSKRTEALQRSGRAAGALVRGL